MTTVSTEHISKTPGVCGGRACIAGHSIRVMDIVAQHDHWKRSPAEIVEQFPTITLADVYADMIRTLRISAAPVWRWKVFGSGYYNFKMVDNGAVPAAGTDRATRINEYGAAIGSIGCSPRIRSAAGATSTVTTIVSGSATASVRIARTTGWRGGR